MINRYKLYLYLFLVSFWLLSCMGFVSEELIPPLAKARNSVYILCDAVFALLGVLTVRKRGDVIVLLSFLTLGLISTVFVNYCRLFDFVNGTRDFFGLLFAVPILRWFMTGDHREEFNETMHKVLKVWLWLQAVTITYQFLKYGANDHGGGTMGFGASGLMSVSIYLISFFLIVRHWDSSHYFRSLWENRIYIFLLYPTFLNETKVSFILLFAYFILLIKFDKSMLVKMLYILPVAVVAFIGLGNIYLTVTKQDADDLLSEDFYVQYLYGEDLDFMIDAALMIQDGTMDVDPRDWWTVDIPRIAKLVLINPYLRADSNGGVWLGAGLGQFKGTTFSNPPRFARLNAWLLNGSRPWIFFVYVQLGILGVVWFFGAVAYYFNITGSRYPLHRKVMVLLGLIVAIMLIYNDMLRFFNVDTIIFYIVLYMKYYRRDQEETVKHETSRKGIANL